MVSYFEIPLSNYKILNAVFSRSVSNVYPFFLIGIIKTLFSSVIREMVIPSRTAGRTNCDTKGRYPRSLAVWVTKTLKLELKIL